MSVYKPTLILFEEIIWVETETDRQTNKQTCRQTYRRTQTQAQKQRQRQRRSWQWDEAETNDIPPHVHGRKYGDREHECSVNRQEFGGSTITFSRSRKRSRLLHTKEFQRLVSKKDYLPWRRVWAITWWPLKIATCLFTTCGIFRW